MKKKFFGTDGIRGLANKGNISPDTLLRIAQAAGSCFQQENRRHLVVIGKDTRLSGYMVEPSLTAGFISVGMNVVLVGPLPTPAIALLTQSLRADLGVVISASHNPYTDNGIKLFTAEGNKLSDEQELKIEQKIQDFKNEQLTPSQNLGRAKRLEDAAGRYIEFVKSTFPSHLRLDGLKIVIDCANGAAYQIAPMILWELGAEIIPIGVTPNGRNINLDCGATSPGLMTKTVIEEKADIGICLDGDADRLIVCDEKGDIIQGDQIIGLIASAWKKRGILKGNAAVSTIMSNMALEQFLKEKEIEFIQTPVGDRHVGEAMKKHGCNVGGEPSGHIILNDYISTGDGLIAALQILSILVQEKGPASKICHPFSLTPQITKSLKLKNKKILQTPDVVSRLEKESVDWEKEGGRLLVRLSGTEPVVRIMAEGKEESKIKALLESIEKFLREEDSKAS